MQMKIDSFSTDSVENAQIIQFFLNRCDEVVLPSNVTIPFAPANRDVAAIVIPEGRTLSGGYGTVLRASTARASVWVQGDNTSIKNITLDHIPNLPRGVAPQDHGLCILNSKNVKLTHVKVKWAKGAAFYTSGSHFVEIEACEAKNSRADGFHNTDGSSFVKMDKCVADGVGDDYFAVVSYDNELPCHHIDISNGYGLNQQLNGRGLSVIGGYLITYKRMYVRDCTRFGIICASELVTDWSTHEVDGVDFEDIVVDGTGSKQPDPQNWHGVVAVGRAGNLVKNVTTRNVKLRRVGGVPYWGEVFTENVDLTGVR